MMYWGDTCTRGGTGFNRMIVLSLAVHIMLLFLLIYTPARSAPKWTFGPVYSVQLVSMPAASPAKGRHDDASLKEIMGGASTGLRLRKQESATGPLPNLRIAPLEIKKKLIGNEIEGTLKTEGKKVQFAPRQLVADRAVKKADTAAPGTIERTAAPSAPARGNSGDGEFNAKMSLYYARIWSRIKELWTLPQGLAPRENIEVVIHARILRDGTVTDIGFEKKSGHRSFDESALRTVNKANPFPPLPVELQDGSIEVGIRFHSAEFQ